MKNGKTGKILAIVFAALLVILAVVFALTREKPVDGTKNIEVRMVYDDTDRTVKIRTEEEYLRGAMEQENLVEGEDGEYGLFITAIDGREADMGKQEWWSFTKNGEFSDTGIEMTVIEDGDKFEFTLETGW